MTSKHTPGPWHVSLAAVTVTGDLEIGDQQNGRRQAIINSQDYYGRFSEAVANARLIATAPEMLELLEYTHQWFAADTDVMANEMQEKLRAMISKVKGE